MARIKFVHFVPRDKPPKRPRRHKKILINPKKEATRNIIDKEDNILY